MPTKTSKMGRTGRRYAEIMAPKVQATPAEHDDASCLCDGEMCPAVWEPSYGEDYDGADDER